MVYTPAFLLLQLFFLVLVCFHLILVGLQVLNRISVLECLSVEVCSKVVCYRHGFEVTPGDGFVGLELQHEEGPSLVILWY